jgi:hypothetical protein
MNAVDLVLLACVLDFAPLAQAQRAGVIDDPAGSVDVRAEKNADAAVIATVKTGEPFTFECENDAEWCKVTLASGKSGWMHLSSIRLHFTAKDLPSREKGSGWRIGDRTIRAWEKIRLRRRHAARCAWRRQGAETIFLARARCRWRGGGKHRGVPTVVYHILGDEKFAKFLLAQPLPYRMMVRNRILSDGLMPPASVYLSRHFPLTAKALFQLEMVDWISPNGLLCDPQSLHRRVGVERIESRACRADREEDWPGAIGSDAR